MLHTLMIGFLALLIILCIIALFRIQPEESPHKRQHLKPREGETTAMPAILKPDVPRKD